MIHLWLGGLLLLLLGLLSGYATGRRLGEREGMAAGMAFAPLDLRRRTLEQGYCRICGYKPQETEGSPVPLRFAKMHGLGNSYVCIDLVTQAVELDWAELARRVTNVNVGLGADGLILILPGDDGADFRMRLFGADGSEAEMCYNGIRCVAKYVYDHGLTDKNVITVHTPVGTVELAIEANNGKTEAVRVDMGELRLRRSDVPMLGGDHDFTCREEPTTVADITLDCTAASMGGPHIVTFVPDVANFPVCTTGPEIEQDPRSTPNPPT